MTLPGLALLIVAVSFAEVAYRRVSGRAMLPWMRDSSGVSAAAIGFEQFDSLFDLGKKCEFEQRQVVLMHRENPGDGAPGGPEVDLTSGHATLRRAE